MKDARISIKNEQQGFLTTSSIWYPVISSAGLVEEEDGPVLIDDHDAVGHRPEDAHEEAWIGEEFLHRRCCA
ncbi:MAG: hypothetical protein MZV64_71280 [Ignavibacteriales bacterium]|nr:hypothetical protein [Ignavibacteriales bacterium]